MYTTIELKSMQHIEAICDVAEEVNLQYVGGNGCITVDGDTEAVSALYAVINLVEVLEAGGGAKELLERFPAGPFFELKKLHEVGALDSIDGIDEIMEEFVKLKMEHLRSLA